VWLWLLEKKTIAIGALGSIVLFDYEVIRALQPAEFGKLYLVYDSIFIVSATFGAA
jgi:small multidrug resistance family-3 protein